MSRTINYIERERIININKKIIDLWNARHSEKPEQFMVDIGRIDEILDTVRNIANNPDYEKSLIEKAAYLVGGLSWNQAFSGANKRTAVLACTLFLAENGYKLNISPSRNPELRQLLFDIQEERAEINRDIINKIILYISKTLERP